MRGENRQIFYHRVPIMVSVLAVRHCAVSVMCSSRFEFCVRLCVVYAPSSGWRAFGTCPCFSCWWTFLLTYHVQGLVMVLQCSPSIAPIVSTESLLERLLVGRSRHNKKKTGLRSRVLAHVSEGACAISSHVGSLGHARSTRSHYNTVDRNLDFAEVPQGQNRDKIRKFMENPLTYIDLYIKHIKMVWKWLANCWGVPTLCAPLRGIPGRGLFFLKSRPLLIKSVFLAVFSIKPRFL